MNPSTWAALASLAFLMLVQLVGLAFMFGGLFARLKSVEGRPTDADCKAELAAVNATLNGFKEAMERIERHVTDRLEDFGRELTHVRNNAAMAKELASARRSRDA